MEQLLYIIPLSILPALVYCIFLYLNLPFRSINLKVAFGYILFGTLSVGGLFTFFETFPWWNKIADSITNPIFNRTLYLHIKFFLEVGFIEELSKLVTFLIIDKYRRDNFKDINDTAIGTIVYVGMISLGFAIIENVLYGMRSVTPASTLIWRSFTAVVAHLFFGLYMGYFIVRGRLKNVTPKSLVGALFKRYPKLKPIFYTGSGLLIASIIHGLYDLQLVANSPNGLSGAYILFIALTIGIILCFKDIKKRLKKK